MSDFYFEIKYKEYELRVTKEDVNASNGAVFLTKKFTNDEGVAYESPIVELKLSDHRWDFNAIGNLLLKSIDNTDINVVIHMIRSAYQVLNAYSYAETL